MNWASGTPQVDLRLLFSGGIESSVLAAEAEDAGLDPVLIYVGTGTRWQDAEKFAARKFLDAVRNGYGDNMVQIDVSPVGLKNHWAYGEGHFPRAGAPVSDLEIPRRNSLLLNAVAAWDASAGESHLVMGTTKDNPYPDGTRTFFDTMERRLKSEYGRDIRIITPLLGLAKHEVIARGRKFPLDLTFSCVASRTGIHCGVCLKCAARKGAFNESGVADKTKYQE